MGHARFILPKTARLPPPYARLGNKYVSYNPGKGGTLTVVNLKQFKEWLDAAVKAQRSIDARSTRQTSERAGAHTHSSPSYA